jgi:hypothetical protein
VCDPKEPEKAARYDATSSGNWTAHLARAHEIYLSKKISLINQGKDNQPNVPTVYTPNRQSMQEKLVTLVAVNHLSFRIIESREFADFAIELCPDAKNFLGTADSLKNWATKCQTKLKKTVIKKITDTATTSHVSFDGWTAPNGYSVLGIVLTWFDDKDFEVRNILLGVRNLDGNHSGEAMANCISKLLKEYSITSDRIGHYISDNVGSNDRAIAALGGAPDQRMRCLGHILNLGARAIIEAFEESDTDDDDEDEDDNNDNNVCEVEFNFSANKIPVIKRLRTIAKAIRRSNILSARWKKEFPTMILLDNATRWNSVLNMINSVIAESNRVDQFIWAVKREHPRWNDGGKLPEMSKNDWEALTLLRDTLQPFADFTMRFQGIRHPENQLTSLCRQSYGQKQS